jgi:hypothetical protein
MNTYPPQSQRGTYPPTSQHPPPPQQQQHQQQQQPYPHPHQQQPQMSEVEILRQRLREAEAEKMKYQNQAFQVNSEMFDLRCIMVTAQTEVQAIAKKEVDQLKSEAKFREEDLQRVLKENLKLRQEAAKRQQTNGHGASSSSSSSGAAAAAASGDYRPEGSRGGSAEGSSARSTDR